MKRDFTIAIIKTLKWITLITLIIITAGIALLGTGIFELFLYILIYGIPYLIIAYVVTSFWLGIIFLIKYIKKKRNIVKTILLSCSIILLLFATLKVLIFTGDYVIKVNSRVDEISNPEISEFIKSTVSGNPYIIDIEISQDISYRSKVEINYFDKWFETKEFQIGSGFVPSNDNNIFDYAENITVQKRIISIILLMLIIVLYVYFCRYIIKEYNILTNTESNDNMAKQNLIKICSLVGIIAIAIIIFIVVNVISNSGNNFIVMENKNDNNVENLII